MFEYKVQIKGMACDMCEAHINEVIRNHFNVKKVSSNHKTNIATILSEEDIDEEKLKEAITGIGYDYMGMTKSTYVKKDLFVLFK